MSPHHLQMSQHRQITIHKPIHAVLHTRVFFRRQPPARDGAFDTFLEARLGELVDRCGGSKS